MTVRSTSDHEARVSRLINLRSWAVVGVSHDPLKFGHRVFLALLESGYQVQGVNPKGGVVAGHELFSALADLPEKARCCRDGGASRGNRADRRNVFCAGNPECMDATGFGIRYCDCCGA